MAILQCRLVSDEGVGSVVSVSVPLGASDPSGVPGQMVMAAERFAESHLLGTFGRRQFSQFVDVRPDDDAGWTRFRMTPVPVGKVVYEVRAVPVAAPEAATAERVHHDGQDVHLYPTPPAVSFTPPAERSVVLDAVIQDASAPRGVAFEMDFNTPAPLVTTEMIDGLAEHVTEHIAEHIAPAPSTAPAVTVQTEAASPVPPPAATPPAPAAQPVAPPATLGEALRRHRAAASKADWDEHQKYLQEVQARGPVPMRQGPVLPASLTEEELEAAVFYYRASRTVRMGDGRVQLLIEIPRKVSP